MIRRGEQEANRIVGDLVRQFYNTSPEERMNQEVLGYVGLDNVVEETGQVETMLMDDLEDSGSDDDILV